MSIFREPKAFVVGFLIFLFCSFNWYWGLNPRCCITELYPQPFCLSVWDSFLSSWGLLQTKSSPGWGVLFVVLFCFNVHLPGEQYLTGVMFPEEPLFYTYPMVKGLHKTPTYKEYLVSNLNFSGTLKIVSSVKTCNT